jgi:AcrR family transcriptional regulator
MAGRGALESPAEGLRPTGPRAEAREQAILDAALELVMEVGYDRLSMDALAERARAGKATIYRHWSGKAQVVAEAIRRRKSEHEIRPDTGSLRGDLRAALGHMCDSVTADEGLVAGVMSAMRSDPELAELMRTQVLDQHGKLDAIVERAIARGELPVGSSAALAYEVAPAVVMSRLLFQNLPMDEAFTDHLVDDVILPLLRQGLPPPAVP